jgi:hypothetical protein
LDLLDHKLEDAAIS